MIAEARPSIKTSTVNIRIWDVTNTGFKAIVLYEGGMGKRITLNQTVNYLACTPGQATIGNLVLFSAGHSAEGIYGNKSQRKVLFMPNNLDGTIPEAADSLTLEDPFLFGALQTFNYPTAVVLRRSVDYTVKDETDKTLTYGTRIIRNVDTSAGSYKNDASSADRFGWICLSTPQQTAPAADVNHDGIVDTQDVLTIYRHMQEGSKGDCDVNGDGLVDTQDVLAVYKYIQEH